MCVCVCPICPSESAVTNEVVELAARWPVDVNKRMNAGICGQLCYYCTPAKCLQVTSTLKLEKKRIQQQRTITKAALQVRGGL